jgi:predicted aldo/keto reductase-like oxidoreductase
MKRIRLGKSGLTVSQIGFGGIPIQRLAEKEAIAVVRGCLDRGVDFIDTARAYTTSEEHIGKAIAGRRDGVVLATKSVCRDKAGLLADLETSLRLLGSETIDLYQLHGVSTMEDYQKVTQPGGALEGALEAQRSGKIRHIGFTSHSLDISNLAVDSGLFETILFPLNFVGREPGEALYPLAIARDVGFIVMKPLGGGLLGNARLAFKYLLQFSQAVSIPGIEKIEELEEILRIVSEPARLTQTDLDGMERIRQELGSRFCRRCQYCQPCPQGIPIAQVLSAENVWKRIPLADFLQGYAAPIEKAAACEKCGECEAKCPYGLPIREMLDESLALYQRAKADYEATVAN